MIDYDAGSFRIFQLCRCYGVVYHKALLWAIPAAMLAVGTRMYVNATGKQFDAFGVSQVWVAYNFCLTFMLVFRTNHAYARFFEGIRVMHAVRASWLNATSSLFAFTSDGKDKEDIVSEFRHLVVRLVSLMYCTALQNVANMADESFEILDLTGIDEQRLYFLTLWPHDKCEIILQWVQRYIITSMNKGVVVAPPPIVSRVFQELGNGIVDMKNAQVITDIPLPFPYYLLMNLLLMVSTIVNPMVTAILVNRPEEAGVLSFLSCFVLWNLEYVAAEIESPFGDDTNDLPVAQMQQTMNTSLLMLVEPDAQSVPVFTMPATQEVQIYRCPKYLCQSEGTYSSAMDNVASSSHHITKAQARSVRRSRASEICRERRMNSTMMHDKHDQMGEMFKVASDKSTHSRAKSKSTERLTSLEKVKSGKSSHTRSRSDSGNESIPSTASLASPIPNRRMESADYLTVAEVLSTMSPLTNATVAPQTNAAEHHNWGSEHFQLSHPDQTLEPTLQNEDVEVNAVECPLKPITSVACSASSLLMMPQKIPGQTLQASFPHGNKSRAQAKTDIEKERANSLLL